MGEIVRGVIKLSSEQVNLLQGRFPPLTYHNPVELFYEGHIPNAVFLIINGKVLLFKRKRCVSELGRGNLLGIEELLHTSQIKFCAKIGPQGQVSVLAKSDIISILHNPEDELHSLITTFL